MKTKFLIIYLAAGAAFLAASLWVFLSNGRSARAIRYKYKLGGIMLTAMTMMTAASCGGCTPPVVTCYEPVMTCYDMPAPTNVLTISVKDKTQMSMTAGDILLICIERPSFESFVCRINAASEDAKLIQSANFSLPESSDGAPSYELKLEPTAFKGDATVNIYGIYKDSDDKPQETLLDGSGVSITIY